MFSAEQWPLRLRHGFSSHDLAGKTASFDVLGRSSELVRLILADVFGHKKRKGVAEWIYACEGNSTQWERGARPVG